MLVLVIEKSKYPQCGGLHLVRMIRYEMVLGIDLIDCLASYDEGLSGTYRGALLVPHLPD